MMLMLICERTKNEGNEKQRYIKVAPTIIRREVQIKWMGQIFHRP